MQSQHQPTPCGTCREPAVSYLEGTVWLQVVGLVRVLYEFLQLVEHVAIQEAEERQVDVQCVGPAEPGAGEPKPPPRQSKPKLSGPGR